MPIATLKALPSLEGEHDAAPPVPGAASAATPDPLLRTLEWTGCVLGLVGAFLLATNTGISRWGRVSFLLANFAVIAFARHIRATGFCASRWVLWRHLVWASTAPFWW